MAHGRVICRLQSLKSILAPDCALTSISLYFNYLYNDDCPQRLRPDGPIPKGPLLLLVLLLINIDLVVYYEFKIKQSVLNGYYATL